ncbi:MAG TPA: HD domain-containing protein [Acidobacteriota bacterium]|nr:HD domain-containing protein [Acidobacteriota bacterium]HNT18321.1 HD domain-containing protein [Acidobacteriota bacterium]
MGIIDKALEIALKVHCGQKDKAGKEYILHPVRVMMKMETDEERAAALLHDVIEDSRKLPEERRYTVERLLAEGIPKDVVDAVAALTKPEDLSDTDEAYFNFVRGAKENKLARKVKLADLGDNMDLGRIANPTDADFKRLKKYETAVKILEDDGVTRETP